MSDKWHDRFMEMAQMVGGWSKDPSTKCGCVITCGREVISMGYNGFPQGVLDLPSRYEDRAQKYPRVVHAEMNAILRMNRQEKVKYLVLYTTSFPCSTCAGAIITAGINEVFSLRPSPEFMERWKESMDITESMFVEAGIRWHFMPS